MNQPEKIASNSLSDTELISRILEGEKNLYSSIVRRYNQRLYKVGMSILDDDLETEDVMQVAYINAYENLGKFAFKASFATWITRILINECILRLKRRGRMLVIEDDKLENEMSQQQSYTTETPAMKVLNTELKTILNDAIRKLPEIYRVVFIMREIEDMSVAETKECLSISEVNVKVRLKRAKAMLRDLLSNHYKKEDLFHFHLTRCDHMVEYVMRNI